MKKNAAKRALRLDAHTIRTIASGRLDAVAGAGGIRTGQEVASCLDSCACDLSFGDCTSANGMC